MFLFSPVFNLCSVHCSNESTLHQCWLFLFDLACIFHQACLGMYLLLPSPLAVKIFHRGWFRTTPSKTGLARLIIKCLSCQALRQHPNLFWQPVLHVHSQTSSTHARTHVGIHVQHTFSRHLPWSVHTGPLDSLSIMVFIGAGDKCFGTGLHAVTMVGELKVAGAQLETVALFQIGLCACIHLVLRPSYFVLPCTHTATFKNALNVVKASFHTN